MSFVSGNLSDMDLLPPVGREAQVLSHGMYPGQAAIRPSVNVARATCCAACRDRWPETPRDDGSGL
jgi:hypothetical protein